MANHEMTPSLLYRLVKLIVRNKNVIVAVLFLVSLGLGVYGNIAYERQSSSPSVELTILETVTEIAPAVFRAVYETSKYFFLEAEAPHDEAGLPVLLWTQYMAPLSLTFFLILVICSTARAEWTRIWIAWRWRGHTVICGTTENALAFAKSESESNDKQKVVLIAEVIEDVHRDAALLHGFSVLVGDPMDHAVLAQANIARADRMIVALSDDGNNLEIAMRAQSMVLIGKNTNSNGRKLRAFVSIKDRQLWRQLARSDVIQRAVGDRFELVPFNLSIWAARRFTWTEPLWAYADLRGQERVHVVFFGYDAYVEALIGQLPPCCVYRDHQRPFFTLLVDDREAVEAHLHRAYPLIKEIADINIEHFDQSSGAMTKELMQKIESPDQKPEAEVHMTAIEAAVHVTAIEAAVHVTAIIVSRDTPEKSLRTAIAAQDAMRVFGCWGAPVYVRLSKCEGISTLLRSVETARKFADVVEPFGVEDRLCNVSEIDGGLEAVAKAFHIAYCDARETQSHIDDPNRSLEPMVEWENLRETYRESNRRAVDHIKPKLMAAGYNVPSGDNIWIEDKDLLSDTHEISALARNEHKSWQIGRIADGWRKSDVRNDTRKQHPDLVDYEELSDSTKIYDMEQIEFLRDYLSGPKRVKDILKIDKDIEPARPDYWIGFIGKNLISPQEATTLSEKLIEDVLAPVIASHPTSYFTIVTPLAPGSDFVMTQSAIDYFVLKNVPHRVIVVEAVPVDHMIEDYHDAYFAGGTWNGKAENVVSPSTGPEDWRAISLKISAEREELIQRSSVEWVIDLVDPDTKYHEQACRNDGYHKAADYIDQRSVLLVAAHRPAEVKGKPGKGGTQATLNDRMDRLSAGAHSGYSTQVLDLSTGKVQTFTPSREQ